MASLLSLFWLNTDFLKRLRSREKTSNLGRKTHDRKGKKKKKKVGPQCLLHLKEYFWVLGKSRSTWTWKECQSSLPRERCICQKEQSSPLWTCAGGAVGRSIPDIGPYSSGDKTSDKSYRHPLLASLNIPIHCPAVQTQPAHYVSMFHFAFFQITLIKKESATQSTLVF